MKKSIILLVALAALFNIAATVSILETKMELSAWESELRDWDNELRGWESELENEFGFQFENEED